MSVNTTWITGALFWCTVLLALTLTTSACGRKDSGGNDPAPAPPVDEPAGGDGDATPGDGGIAPDEPAGGEGDEPDTGGETPGPGPVDEAPGNPDIPAGGETQPPTPEEPDPDGSQPGEDDQAVAPEDQACPVTPYGGRRALLEHLGRGVIAPLAGQFRDEVSRFRRTVDDTCAAGAAIDFAAAQSGWLAVNRLWQELEPLRVGPLAENNDALRFAISSWPQRNPCGTDREVARARQAGAAYVLPPYPNRKGMTAAEYLLFDDPDHGCSAAVPDTKDWNTLPVAERMLRRCSYLSLVATDLEEQATLLRDAWDPAAGDYTAGWIGKGVDQAFTEVYQALYFLDKDMKDEKLAGPAGIAVNGRAACPTGICPDKLEGGLSRSSREALLANSRAIRSAFTGNPANCATDRINQGIQAELAAVGAADKGRQFLDALDGFIDRLSASEVSLWDLAVAMGNQACTPGDERELCLLHGDLKQVTDLFKNDMRGALGVAPPARAAGDND